MTPEQLEKLRNGKCGEAFKTREHTWSEWSAWAAAWDAAMRELAEEAAAILMAADQEDAPTLDWGVCRAGLRKLADYGEEKN